MKKVYACLLACAFVHLSLYAQQTIIPVYEGQAPGSMQGDWKEAETNKTPIGKTIAYNITNPSLLVFRPEQGKANGTVVILVPGGGLRILNVEQEGTSVAKQLTEKGITVFVLKHRLGRSRTEDPWKEMMESMKDSAQFQSDNEAIRELAYQDLKAAMQRIRQWSTVQGMEWKRMGVIGFSAGAILTLQLVKESAAVLRPDFCGILYPPIKSGMDSRLTGKLPPVFIACAADDKLAPPGPALQLCQAWLNTGGVAEMHLYAAGGHGLRVGKSATWIERMNDWMERLEK